MVKKYIYKIYHSLQKNPHFFALVAWLQSHYITVLIGDVVNYPQNLRNRRNPQKYKKKSFEYFENNKQRVDSVISLLEDHQSEIA